MTLNEIESRIHWGLRYPLLLAENGEVLDWWIEAKLTWKEPIINLLHLADLWYIAERKVSLLPKNIS